MPRSTAAGKVDIGEFEHRSTPSRTRMTAAPARCDGDRRRTTTAHPFNSGQAWPGETILLDRGPIEISHNVTSDRARHANRLEIEPATGAAVPSPRPTCMRAEGNAADSAGSERIHRRRSHLRAGHRPGVPVQRRAVISPFHPPPTSQGTGTVGGWFKLIKTQLLRRSLNTAIASNYGGRKCARDPAAATSTARGLRCISRRRLRYSPTSSPMSLNSWHYYITARLRRTPARIYSTACERDGSRPRRLLPGVGTDLVSAPSIRGARPRRGSAGTSPAASQRRQSRLRPISIPALTRSADRRLAHRGPQRHPRLAPVNRGVSATISGVTIGGGATPSGGGIDNAGKLSDHRRGGEPERGPGRSAGIRLPRTGSGGAIPMPSGKPWSSPTVRF